MGIFLEQSPVSEGMQVEGFWKVREMFGFAFRSTAALKLLEHSSGSMQDKLGFQPGVGEPIRKRHSFQSKE